MTKPKLTPEFPVNVKPVHVGVYRTRVPGRPEETGYPYAYWNGVYWSFGDRSAAQAMYHTNDVSAYQTRHWRGLAEEPK